MNKSKVSLYSVLHLFRHSERQGRLPHRRLAFSLILVILLSMGTSAVLGAPGARYSSITEDAAGRFTIQRVDAPKLFHSMSTRSLRLDSQNRPHVAYGGDSLYYAYYDGSKWQTETVDTTPGVGSYASLALDANNRPYISYYDAINGALKYASKPGASWEIQTIDGAPLELLQAGAQTDYDGTLAPAGDADLREWRYFFESQPETQDGETDLLAITENGIGMFTSIALDAFTHPSISYYDALNGDLKYAHWTGSAWDIQTVDEPGAADDGNWGRYSSLVIDANGRPHISTYDSSKKDLIYVVWDGSRWDAKRLDSANDVGMYSSLALDNNGRPHISYYDSKNGNLKYIRLSGSAWITPVTVESAGDVGQFTSLALANGNPLRPFISYFDATNSDLELAYVSDGTWIKNTIATDEFVGRFTSLALDGGSPRISFYDSGRGTFKYAIKTGANSWTIQVVDDSADVGAFPSLDFDANGFAHISYYDDIQDNLKYAYWTGSTWNITNVDITGSVGLYTSLKVDKAGRPHISYYDSKNDDIRYARWTGTNWHIQIVDSTIESAGEEGMRTSLVLDSQDRPRIAYFDGKNNDLKVALWTGSSWIVRLVDSNDNTGKYASLAIDNQDKLHVSYYNATSKSLRYALGRADGSSWDRQTVDTDQTGLYTSIILDNANFPHIAYFEDLGDNLRYARWTGTTWEKSTVDSEGAVGWYASLGLDPLGRPHISYYDYGLRNLKYAFWNGGAWQIQIVDDLGEVGQGTSLGFLIDGSPAISYYDVTNGDLKYAAFNPFNFTNFLYLPAILR